MWPAPGDRHPFRTEQKLTVVVVVEEEEAAKSTTTGGQTYTHTHTCGMMIVDEHVKRMAHPAQTTTTRTGQWVQLMEHRCVFLPPPFPGLRRGVDRRQEKYDTPRCSSNAFVQCD